MDWVLNHFRRYQCTRLVYASVCVRSDHASHLAFFLFLRIGQASSPPLQKGFASSGAFCRHVELASISAYSRLDPDGIGLFWFVASGAALHLQLVGLDLAVSRRETGLRGDASNKRLQRRSGATGTGDSSAIMPWAALALEVFLSPARAMPACSESGA